MDEKEKIIKFLDTDNPFSRTLLDTIKEQYSTDNPLKEITDNTPKGEEIYRASQEYYYLIKDLL